MAQNLEIDQWKAREKTGKDKNKKIDKYGKIRHEGHY